jgi:hypothetical protein
MDSNFPKIFLLLGLCALIIVLLGCFLFSEHVAGAVLPDAAGLPRLPDMQGQPEVLQHDELPPLDLTR